MPASHSPISSLFAWLTVSVFLMAGVPDPRQPAGCQEGQLREMAAGDLAKSFASLDLAEFKSLTQLMLLGFRDLAGPSTGVVFVSPKFILPKSIRAGGYSATRVRRLSLVGIVELRI